MLTALQIGTDLPEYSRLETSRSVVRVRIIPSPATGLVNESVVVSLVKKGVTIWSTPIVFNGDASKGQIVEIDLKSITDGAGITHITRGNYTVEATQDMVTASDSFSVALITAKEMRKTYCQGLRLVAGFKLAAKRQPSLVTGVTIIDVSKDSKPGVMALAYNATNKTLTWGTGPAIGIAGETNAILLDARNNFIEVDIDQFSLPDTDQSEGILIAEESLDDDFIHREVKKATQEIETLLKVFLEPTRMATEPYYSNPAQGEYFDYLAAPTYYQQRDFNLRGGAWLLDLPYHQVSHIDEVSGYLGNTKSLTISNGAITVNRKSGQLSILPYNNQYSFLYTFFATLNFWGIREFIPDFWRYKGVAGIEEHVPGEILKLVGITAAISILTTAEQAHRAGMTSESVSKDGVSHSRSYNSKGIYDSTIQEYKEWQKIMVPKLRNQYRGIPCVVL